MKARRIQLMEECWPILSKAFAEALATAAAGKGQAAYDSTRPGRLVTTVPSIIGGSAVFAHPDASISPGPEYVEYDIDHLVELCRDQNNPAPVIAELLEPVTHKENEALLIGMASNAKPASPNLSIDEFLNHVSQQVPARPLVLLLRAATDERTSKEPIGEVQVRTHVPLPGGARALAYSGAKHLVVHQVIEPLILEWDLADLKKAGDKVVASNVALIASTRAVLRRQAEHDVFQLAS